MTQESRLLLLFVDAGKLPCSNSDHLPWDWTIILTSFFPAEKGGLDDIHFEGFGLSGKRNVLLARSEASVASL